MKPITDGSASCSVWAPSQTAIVNGIITAGYAQGNSTWNHSVQSSNYLTYNLNMRDHALTVVGLYEYQEGTNQNINAKATNLSTYLLGYYKFGLGLTQQTTSGYSSSELQSFMGRINYAYKVINTCSPPASGTTGLPS